MLALSKTFWVKTFGFCLLWHFAAASFAAKPTTIYLLRHFEKQTAEASQASKVNKASEVNRLKERHSKAHSRDPSLTELGLKRANALAAFMADKNIQAIFSSPYKRTMQSAMPTAQALNLTITAYDPRQLTDFSQHLHSLSSNVDGNIIVLGHSNTTPQLLKLLGGPERELSEDDYGDVFYLNLTQDKAEAASSFKQLVLHPRD